MLKHQIGRTWYSTEDKTDEAEVNNRNTNGAEDLTEDVETETENREVHKERITEQEAYSEDSCNETEFKEMRFQIFDLEKYGFQYNNMEEWTDLK